MTRRDCRLIADEDDEDKLLMDEDFGCRPHSLDSARGNIREYYYHDDVGIHTDEWKRTLCRGR